MTARAAALALALLAAPAAAPAAGATQDLVLCGKSRAATVVGTAQAARALGSSNRARTIVDRCADGRWVRLTTKRLPTGRAATGDYRLRRSAGARRTTFVRVGAGEIVDVPVTFTVKNQNRTPLPCLGAPDGATVTVRGSLVAPRAVLDGPDPTATLYSHGLAYSQKFFRLQSLPGYDYGLEQARNGHASVVVDRIGYPASQGPDGRAICYSSQADANDQLITALKSGAYTAGDGQGTRFSKVALAGHSAGGFIAEMTQYFFGSADALVVLGYSDTGAQPKVLVTLGMASMKCLTAPDRAGGTTGPSNYAFFGETEADFRSGHVFNAEEVVVREALANRTRDPCGDLLSIGPSFLANQLGVRTIDDPVLLVIGTQDAFFGPPAGTLQDLLAYVSSPDHEYVALSNTGHGLTLGRTHGEFRNVMDRWLKDHGY